MHDMSNKLYELCETLEKDLDKTNEKLRKAGGDLSGADLEYVDKLTHALKSVKTILAMMEAEDGYSYDGGGSYAGARGGNRGGNRGGMSGARGRNARRDSMGRYASRDGYPGRRGYDRRGNMSYDGARDELMEHVDELAEMAKDEETRAMIQKFKRELQDA